MTDNVANVIRISKSHWVMPCVVSLALVIVTTALVWEIDVELKPDHLIFIYFVPTTFIAVRYGSVLAMATTIASDLCAAVFLYPPKFTIYIADSRHVVELILFTLIALMASQVVSRLAADADVKK